MTLLVIELKLPDQRLIDGADDLAQALANLLPKVLAIVMPLSRRAERASGSAVPRPAPQ